MAWRAIQLVVLLATRVSQCAKRDKVIVLGTTMPPGSFHREQGKATQFCSYDHPYAYGKAQFCCSNLYKTNDTSSSMECNGAKSNIYSDVACCLGDHTVCPTNRVCKNSLKALGWSQWSVWSTCYVSCSSNGVQNRTRTYMCLDVAKGDYSHTPCTPVRQEAQSQSCCTFPRIWAGQGSISGLVEGPCRYALGCSSPSCSTPPSTGLLGAQAAVLSGRAVVCGGCSSSGNAQTNCYSLNPTNNAWEGFASLLTSRRHHAGAMTDRGWWITGGSNVYSYFASTELYNPSTGTWVSGPTIPATARDCHCATHITGSNTSFIGGGVYNPSGTATILSDAWTYNWATSNWVQMPNMPTANYAHSCGVRLDQYTGKATSVIAAGGYSSATDTLVFSLDLKTFTWTTLPSLPSSVELSAGMMADGLDLYIINTYGNNIMKFNAATSTFQLTGQTTAGTSSWDAVAIVMTNGTLKGC